MALPQLRVRTEFSFRNAFGPIARVADALRELKAPSAGIVDGSTWGHVRWSKALPAVGVLPLYGTEVAVAREGRPGKALAWALAAETRGFYNFSTATRVEGADPVAEFARAQGCVRFAGTGLTDPECFDYVDINPASPLAIAAALRLAQSTRRPLVVTSDNAYPAVSDFRAFKAIVDRERITPQHLLSDEELRRALPQLTAAQWKAACRGTREAAERCAAAATLPVAPLIHVEGDLRALAEAGRQRRLAAGHIAAWTADYAARLERELEAIEAKAFTSYFLVVADLVMWAKQRMLVGPGRGSSAGSLLCYVVGITEVDPLVHDLLFERFIDVTRNDLPDIDIDFSDAQRDKVFEYLAEKYGREKVARIGNVNTLKPRSALAEVCKRLGVPDHERFAVLNVLIEYSSGDSRYGKGMEDTFTNTDVGRAVLERNPELAVVAAVENHAWHTGVHAAGVIVSNEPVTNYCTVGADGVAHIDKPDSEALNLLKIDALGLSTLGIIEDAGVVTADELYALKLQDPAVLRLFNDRRFVGVFQFEGQAQRGVSAQIPISSFTQLDHITALARPGPLGGGATGHYIARARGEEAVEFKHPSMAAYLAGTLGVVLYQEQVMRIVRELGKFSWADTTIIRKAMSGRKGKEFFDRQGEKFVAGAMEDGLSRDAAVDIWNEICSFGAWGMNKSHTCAYAIISYWCMWMKCYHPVAYAAACLRRAKDDDQTLELLREMRAEGVGYVPFDLERSQIHWSVQDGQLVGGFSNLVGFGPIRAAAAVEARNAGTLTDKERAQIAKAPVKFAELFPLRTAYGALYDDPEAHGCRAGSVVAMGNALPAEGDVLMLGRVVKKEQRDMNETVRVARRGGKRVRGQSLFVDLWIKDDTGVPVIVRIDRWDYAAVGREALEHLRVDEDVVLVRGRRVPNFPMIGAERIKCLTQPQLFMPRPAHEKA